MSKSYGTDTSGFKLKFIKNITKKQYIELCDMIAMKFNELYGITKLDDMIGIVPEPITEGGMKIIGKLYGSAGGKKWYKSMRHFISHDIDNSLIKYIRRDMKQEKEGNKRDVFEYSKWPMITQTTVEEWRNSDEILIPRYHTSWTKLRAYHGAPWWSRSELVILRECLAKFDIIATCFPHNIKSLLDPAGIPLDIFRSHK